MWFCCRSPSCSSCKLWVFNFVGAAPGGSGRSGGALSSMHVRPSIAPTNKCLLSGDRTRLRRTAHLRNEWRSRVVRRGFERTKRSAGRNTTNVDCPLTYFNHCWNTFSSFSPYPSIAVSQTEPSSEAHKREGYECAPTLLEHKPR